MTDPRRAIETLSTQLPGVITTSVPAPAHLDGGVFATRAR